MSNTPDPYTKEGKEEISKRLSKLKGQGEAARKRALQDTDDEPVGALTNPNELDIRRDRKDED